MKDQKISEISEFEVEDIVALWTRCRLTRPWNDPHADIAFASDSANATILAGRIGGKIVSSVMVGHDGHRGTVYFVAVDPELQNRSLGRGIMKAAEDWLRRRGVWKLNLIVRAENEAVIQFYESIGYSVEERVNLAKWIDPAKGPEA